MSPSIRTAAWLAALLLAASSAAAQTMPGMPGTTPVTTPYLGGPCATPGAIATTGEVLVCSPTGTYRYALPEDIPPAPIGGYLTKPDWFPPLANVFRATDPPACPLTGRVTFTHPLLRWEDVSRIIPQGFMVSTHVTPIDHGYIGVTPLQIPEAMRTEADFVPIYAPADAEILEVSLLGQPDSIRIVLAHGCDTYSVFMVVNRLGGPIAHLQDDLLARQYLNPHVRVLTGDVIGWQRDNPVDFSVHDGAAWLPGFVAPFSYAYAESWKPYTVDPWLYFPPDLAAAYNARMQRVAPPRWGLIDQDIAGAAAGNWFLDGTMGYTGQSIEAYRTATGPVHAGFVEGKHTYAWSHLALARHWVQPGWWVLSTGWWVDPAGDPRQWLIAPEAGQPDPSTLTVTSGTVVYRLHQITDIPWNSRAPRPIDYPVNPGPFVGAAAIRVNADNSLTVELVPADAAGNAPFTAFTPAARTYRR